MRILFSRNFAYAKFRENKTLAKVSEFTVVTELFVKFYTIAYLLGNSKTSLLYSLLRGLVNSFCIWTTNWLLLLGLKGKLLIFDQ